MDALKVHIHDNNLVPHKQTCSGELLLEPGKVIQMHYHDDPCRPCPNGHCHNGTISLLLVDGQLFINFERLPPPNKSTLDDFKPHPMVNPAH